MVFRVMRNSMLSETALLGKAFDALRDRLPPAWSLLELGREMLLLPGGIVIDGAIEVTDPEGASATIIVEAKRRPIEARQVSQLLDNWQRMLLPQSRENFGPASNLSYMIVAPFLGPSAKERLSEGGISFADATGNVRFVTSRPAIFIEAQGETRNPWRENVPLRSLRGRGAGRVVRGLLDYRPPFGTRELAALTRSSVASISRVVDLLDREAILYREVSRGPIVTVEWERLIRRWAADYDFLNANRMIPSLEPRGIPRLFEKLRDADFKYAITGSFAAVRLAPVAEPRLAIIYAENPDAAMSHLGLRPADTGANVLIGQPFDPVVFDRTQCADGITYARVTQVAADLMKGPGRGPAEAESLVEWMHSNEDLWQLPLTQTT